MGRMVMSGHEMNVAGRHGELYVKDFVPNDVPPTPFHLHSEAFVRDSFDLALLNAHTRLEFLTAKKQANHGRSRMPVEPPLSRAASFAHKPRRGWHLDHGCPLGRATFVFDDDEYSLAFVDVCCVLILQPDRSKLNLHTWLAPVN